MRVELYVRVARTPRSRRGYQLAAAPRYDPEPLTVGGYGQLERLHTAQFRLCLEVPDELLAPATVELALDAAAAATITPSVAQAPLERKD